MLNIQSSRPFWKRPFFIIFFLFASGVFAVAGTGLAQDENTIKTQIENKNSEIRELEKEIQRFQAEINQLSKEKNTLQNAIRALEVSGKKLNADISLAQSRIDLAESTIRQLKVEIQEAERKIELNKEAISNTLRTVQEKNDTSLIAALLQHDSLSEYWGSMDTMYAFQQAVSASVEELDVLKKDLDEKRSAQEGLRQQEITLREELKVKAQLVVENKEEQSRILSQTQSKESEYQGLLKERKARKEAFEAEIRDLESRLNLNVDASAIPTSGKGVLAWPVDNVIITQYFGNTAFATANPQVYSGLGHNGIDLGGPVGTTVKSAASGVVVGTGDTDSVCRGASYGRWILVRHDNGLSTLYAHLSHIGVSQGQRVGRGEPIGYMGATGYVTGPHLHFTVYASDGVQVTSMPSKGCAGAVYTIPLADQKAYLNPLSFLP